MDWEQIDDSHKRAKVHGGWLVKAYEDVYHPRHEDDLMGYDWRISMCFVPDAMYTWVLDDDE